MTKHNTESRTIYTRKYRLYAIQNAYRTDKTCHCRKRQLYGVVVSLVYFVLYWYSLYTGWPQKVNYNQVIKNRIKACE